MKIIIGADLVPTSSNRELFVSRQIGSLLGDELISYLSDADLKIFNLEVPLTDRASPSINAGLL